MTISQAATDVPARARQGIFGMWALTSPLNSSLTALNSDPQAAQSDTITVGGATNAKDYIVTANLVDVTYTSDATATVAEIADGLADAINAEPLVRGQMAAVSDGVSVVTVTGLTPGLAYTLTEADAQLVVASVTTAAAAAAVSFGRAVVSDGYTSGESEQLGKLAQASAFTAQVITGNIIFVAAATYLITLRTSTGDLLAQVEVDADTNTNTTAAAITTALNGELAASTILVANVAGAIAFTAEVLGTEFTLKMGTNEAGQVGNALVSIVNTTGPSQATSLERALLGMSLHSSNDATTTVGGTDGSYAANVGMRIARRGVVWVQSTETPAADADVYVELAAGATAGRFYAASSVTRVKLPRSLATWERDGVTTSDTIAAVRLAL